MVTSVVCIRLKLTFSYRKLYANFENFKKFFGEDGRDVYKFTD